MVVCVHACIDECINMQMYMWFPAYVYTLICVYADY